MADLSKNNNLHFSKKGTEELKKILSKYPNSQSAMLPVIHLAQKEFGYIDNEVLSYIATILNLPPSMVKGSASFYTLFTEPEMGKYVIRVCQTLSCSLLGAEHLLNYISEKLGIKPGETTKDKKFTLLKCECLGSCGTAPVMMINEDYYENLSREKIDQLLESLE